MANASLTPIYNRLNGVPAYHPMTAETFTDWSLEAGDMVSVSRGDDTVTAPVSTSRMVWRGQQQITLEATGSKEREAISKISRKKYGRGGGSLTNNNYLYYEITDESGLLHTTIMATESVLRTDIGNDYAGLASYIQQTASSLSFGIDSAYGQLSSRLEITASSLSFGIDNAYSGLRSQLQITSSSLSNRITSDYNGLSSTLRQEVSRLQSLIVQGDGSVVYPQFGDPTTDHEVKEGDVWIQTNAIHSWDDLLDADISWDSEDYNWDELRGSQVFVWKDDKWDPVVSDREIATMTDIDQTNERIALVARSVDTVDGNLRASEARFEVRAQQIESNVIDRTNSINSNITQTASKIRSEVNDTKNGLESNITQTASSIRSEVNNRYLGLSSSITQTASSIRSEVNNRYLGLSSSITQTASSIRLEVNNRYEGLRSSITQTASSITLEVRNRYSGLASRIQQTESSIALKADAILLDGVVYANDLEAMDMLVHSIAATNGDITHLDAYDLCFSNRLLFGTGGGSIDLSDPILEVQISGPTNNQYYLQYKNVTYRSWQNAGSFSRATSLSGSWSGNTWTVSASPQGNTLSVTPVVHPVVSQGAAYTDIYVATGNASSGYDNHGSARRLTLVATGLRVDLKDSNGTVYAQKTCSNPYPSSFSVRQCTGPGARKFTAYYKDSAGNYHDAGNYYWYYSSSDLNWTAANHTVHY